MFHDFTPKHQVLPRKSWNSPATLQISPTYFHNFFTAKKWIFTAKSLDFIDQQL
jgi:hypothetical protein